MSNYDLRGYIYIRANYINNSFDYTFKFLSLMTNMTISSLLKSRRIFIHFLESIKYTHIDFHIMMELSESSERKV